MFHQCFFFFVVKSFYSVLIIFFLIKDVFRQLKKKKKQTEKVFEILQLVCNYLLSAVGSGGKEGFGGAIASK